MSFRIENNKNEHMPFVYGIAIILLATALALYIVEYHPTTNQPQVKPTPTVK